MLKSLQLRERSISITVLPLVSEKRPSNVYESITRAEGVEYRKKIRCEYFPGEDSRGTFEMFCELRTTVMGASGELASTVKKEEAHFEVAQQLFAGGESIVYRLEKKAHAKDKRENLSPDEVLLDHEYVALFPTFSVGSSACWKKFTKMREAFPWPTMLMRICSAPDPYGKSNVLEEVIVETYGGEDLAHTARRLIKSEHPAIRNDNYDVVLRILIQIAKELDRLHQRSYVHGDVHPGNFLIKNFNVQMYAAYILILQNIFPVNNISTLIYEYAKPSDWLGLRMIDPGQMTTENDMVLRRETDWSAPEAKEPFRKKGVLVRKDSQYAVYGCPADIYSLGYLLYVLIGGHSTIERGEGVTFSLHPTHFSYLSKLAECCLVRLPETKNRMMAWINQEVEQFRPTASELCKILYDEYNRFQVEKCLINFLALLKQNKLSDGFHAIVAKWVSDLREKVSVEDNSEKIEKVSLAVFGLLDSRIKLLLAKDELLKQRYQRFHYVYHARIFTRLLEPLLQYLIDACSLASKTADIKSELVNLFSAFKKNKISAVDVAECLLTKMRKDVEVLLLDPKNLSLKRQHIRFTDAWSAYKNSVFLLKKARHKASRPRQLDLGGYEKKEASVWMSNALATPRHNPFVQGYDQISRRSAQGLMSPSSSYTGSQKLKTYKTAPLRSRSLTTLPIRHPGSNFDSSAGKLHVPSLLNSPKSGAAAGVFRSGSAKGVLRSGSSLFSVPELKSVSPRDAGDASDVTAATFSRSPTMNDDLFDDEEMDLASTPISSIHLLGLLRVADPLVGPTATVSPLLLPRRVCSNK